MKMQSESEVAQSCPTLSDPMDCSLPGSSCLATKNSPQGPLINKSCRKRGEQRKENETQRCLLLWGQMRVFTWNLEAIIKDGDDEYEIAHLRPHAGARRAAGGVRMKSGEGEDK